MSRLFLLGFILLLSTTAVASWPADALDRTQLIAWLKAGEFGRLDEVLQGLQQAYEEGRADERAVGHAFGAFSNSDPGIARPLANWRTTRPDSYAALLAEAVYRANWGWHSRGAAWSKDTSRQRFSAMKDAFKQALLSAKLALDKNPRLTPAYSTMMSVFMATGSRGALRAAFEQGLNQVPDSYLIRYQYLWALQPRWGGSMREAKSAILRWDRHTKDNAAIATLAGFPDLIRASEERSGRVVGRKASCEAALLHIGHAIAAAQHWLYYKRQGDYQRCLSDYPAAIASYDRALALSPQNVAALYGRAKAYRKAGDEDAAKKDLDAVIALDALDAKARALRGRLHFDAKRHMSAVLDYEAALTFDEDRADNHVYLGYAYGYHLDNREKAQAHFTRVVELEPDNRDGWYQLTAMRYRGKDCDFVGSARQYQALCATDGKCDAQRLDWTKRSMEASLKRGVCKDQPAAGNDTAD